MKHILFLLAFSPIFLTAQTLSIVQPTAGNYVVKEETYNPDSLLIINYITPVVDSIGMINELFQEQEIREQRKARLLQQINDAEAAIREIAALSAAHTDSLYRDYTQARFADRFTQSGELPNFIIRVGSDFYRASCYIAGNGLLRMELTNTDGSFLSPRQNSAMYITSRRSFYINSLAIWGGGRKDFYLNADQGNRRRWIEEGSNGPVRITQLLER